MGRARPCVILWAALALSVLVSACASVQRDVSLPVTDPNEASNRALFGFNQAVLHPPAEVVKALTPGPVHDRLHDLNANLQEPRIFANDLLQLRFDAAVKTAGRFILNSTFGLGGLFDVASAGGLPQQSGDFGQTLFVWGVPEGPYTIRPYYGPATARDAVGETVDTLGDPVAWALGAPFGWPAYVSIGGLDAAARLSDFKEAEESSIDFYSFVRSAYYQMRRADLRDALGLPPIVESPATVGAPTR